MDDLIDYLAVDFLTDRPKTLLLYIINKWSNVQYNIQQSDFFVCDIIFLATLLSLSSPGIFREKDKKIQLNLHR